MEALYGISQYGGSEKVVKRQKSVTVGAVTDKYFAVAKKKRRLCKYITIFCDHAEKLGSAQKPLKCVWWGLDTYFISIFCLDYNKKPIIFHLNAVLVKGEGKQ